jgi:hypothetical protein
MPRPVLQAMVLADHVYQDRATGKMVIAGTFGTVFVGSVNVSRDEGDRTDEAERGESKPLVIRGPISQVGSPYLYLALVEVHGEVPLTLKFVDLSDANVLFEGQLSVTSTDPIGVAEIALPMPPLPVHKLGTYSLDLLYDAEILGSWRVIVKRMEAEPGGAGGEI